MRIMNYTGTDLLEPRAERGELPSESLAGGLSVEERDAHKREIFDRRTLREKLVDGFRRAWYGPPPEPLTVEEMRMIMRLREDEDDGLPELVPPDDPERLAWEAELRAIGVRPARKWNFPVREPLRRPSLWQRIRYRVSLGW